MYAWATPSYLLDYMTVEEIFMYYDYGLEFEEFKQQKLANTIIQKLSEALGGKKVKKPKQSTRGQDQPDKASFYKHYGDQIKRGE